MRGRLVGLFQFKIAYLEFCSPTSRTIRSCKCSWELQSGDGIGEAAPPDRRFLHFALYHSTQPALAGQAGALDEARSVLQLIGEQDYEELRKIVKIDTQRAAGNRRTTFFPASRAADFLAVSIGIFNQLSGINAILSPPARHFYARRLLEGLQQFAGGGDRRGRPNLLFTVIAVSVIDKIGRKILLLFGAAGTASCLAGCRHLFY